MSDCPVCGGKSAPGAPGLIECGACGLAFRAVKYFGTPAYAEGLEAGIYGSSKTALFFDALDYLETVLPGKGRLLDIGCAGGELLKSAAARGWKPEGIELDARLAALASSNGFTILRRPVEDAGLSAGYYEVVTAFEVFSQMEKPAAAAAEVFRLIKPGGALYMREFNADFHLPLHSLELKGFFAPLGASPSVIHNLNFSARSLGKMLSSAGFREIRIRNSPPTAGDPYRTGGRLGGFLTRGLKVLYYVLAQALWAATLGRFYAGSSLIVTARKK